MGASFFTSFHTTKRRRCEVCWLALWLLLYSLGTASAQRLETKTADSAKSPFTGKHCLGEQKQKLLLNHYLAGSINPLGIGNSLKLSLCTPLITKPGLVFDLSNIEFGLLFLTSPTDVTGGAFVNLVPLSFLVLRAEASGFGIWPIPLQGAGFISLKDPSEFTLAALSPSPFGEHPAGTAAGGRFLLGASLRGELPIGKWVSIAIVDSWNSEYWQLTDGTWNPQGDSGKTLFYAARRDVVLKGPGDWLITNTAALLVGLNVHSNVVLRLGATDDLVYVPSLSYLGNIAAGLLAISVKNLRNLAKEGSFFLRAGAFTHHAFRTGITFALGIDVTYELVNRPHRPGRTGFEPGSGTASPSGAAPAQSQQAPAPNAPLEPAEPSEPVPAGATESPPSI